MPPAQASPAGQPSEMRLLSLLQPEQRQRLLAEAARRTFPKDKAIYSPWDPCNVVYYLVSGSVKIYDITSDGREIIFRICEPDTLFGLSAIFGGEARLVFAHAQEASTVLTIRRERFEQAIAEFPQLSLAVISMLGRRLRQAHTAIAEFIVGDVRSRLAQILLKFAETSCDEDGTVVITNKLTHQDLANMIGATRTTVTKIVNEWKRRGVIDVSHRVIVVNDRDALLSLTQH